MDTNNEPNKNAAIKWIVLSIFFASVAVGGIVSLLLLNSGKIGFLIFFGCFLPLGFCFYKLNKLGYGGQRGYHPAPRPRVYPEELAGIAGKTYAIGEHGRWPYN